MADNSDQKTQAVGGEEHNTTLSPAPSPCYLLGTPTSMPNPYSINGYTTHTGPSRINSTSSSNITVPVTKTIQSSKKVPTLMPRPRTNAKIFSVQGSLSINNQGNFPHKSDKSGANSPTSTAKTIIESPLPVRSSVGQSPPRAQSESNYQAPLLHQTNDNNNTLRNVIDGSDAIQDDNSSKDVLSEVSITQNSPNHTSTSGTFELGSGSNNNINNNNLLNNLQVYANNNTNKFGTIRVTTTGAPSGIGSEEVSPSKWSTKSVHAFSVIPASPVVPGDAPVQKGDPVKKAAK